MNFPSNTTSRSRRRLRFALPALLIAASAFAADPPPTTNLQAAQQAIANAERVDAATLAGVELGEARGKLAAAQLAVEDKKMIVAARFADEARVGAELAAAKSGAAKAKAVNSDIERSTATLIEEMQRKSGDNR
jgi:Domain of unknown function (DUF4398)